MWMANALKKMGGQCFEHIGRPMLLILAEHIMNSPNGAGGRGPLAPFGKGRLEAAPIMCSANIKNICLAYFNSIGYPFF